jgi:hypothetical protein
MADLAQCTAEQVVDAVEAVTLAGNPRTAAEIKAYVNHPDTAVDNALAVAVQLGLLEKDGGKFKAAHPYEHYFSEATESHRIDVLRFALEAFPPYRHFKQRLGFHSDTLRAARETKLRFGYGNHEAEIRETLLSLGQFSGSLTYSTGTGYAVSRSGTVDEFLAVAETISAEGASVDDLLREKLGASAYEYIQNEQDDIINHLRGALQKVLAGELDEGVVIRVGNACENFLVKVAADHNPPINLTGKTGIIQKANALKAGGAIAAKHLGYTDFIGHLRNAAEHGIDPDVNADWSITPAAIRLGVESLLAAIKSVVALQEGRAEF